MHELFELDQTAREAFASYQFNKGNSPFEPLACNLVLNPARLASLPSTIRLLKRDLVLVLL